MQINGRTVDNSWVVPYNPYLSLRYKAHINVEFCSSPKAVKYLCKYTHKGNDRAMVTTHVEGSRGTRLQSIKTSDLSPVARLHGTSSASQFAIGTQESWR